MIDALLHSSLIDRADSMRFEALAGGVFSDIWKVTTPERIFCVKRALVRFKVGSFARSERMAKWNEGLRRAEALGQAGGRLAPREGVPRGDAAVGKVRR